MSRWARLATSAGGWRTAAAESCRSVAGGLGPDRGDEPGRAEEAEAVRLLVRAECVAYRLQGLGRGLLVRVREEGAGDARAGEEADCVRGVSSEAHRLVHRRGLHRGPTRGLEHVADAAALGERERPRRTRRAQVREG